MEKLDIYKQILINALPKLPLDQFIIPKETITKYLNLRKTQAELSNSFRFEFLNLLDSAYFDHQTIKDDEGYFLTPNLCMVSILGTKDKNIIISRIGYDRISDSIVTFIDKYDNEKCILVNLYKHTHCINCISASLNDIETLLSISHKDIEIVVDVTMGTCMKDIILNLLSLNLNVITMSDII